MRVILAGIFCYGLLMLLVVALFGPLEGKIPELLITPLLVIAFCLVIIVACVLFDRQDLIRRHQSTEELESRGLVTSVTFHAKRALQVDEFEDEGLHYYLELGDGRVLFLSGQYLYDSEPIDDDPEVNQERMFPCTEFTVKRHKTEGYVLELIPHGPAFEPEDIAPNFSEADFRFNNVPEDGDIITGKSFEDIKEWLCGAERD